jgi:hypothetical protein
MKLLVFQKVKDQRVWLNGTFSNYFPARKDSLKTRGQIRRTELYLDLLISVDR